MKDYRIVSVPRFTVAGLSVVTSNDRSDQIGALWQQFYGQNVAAQIPNKKSDDIYSLYIDYQGDYTKPYRLVIGCKVDLISSLRAGLVAKTVPAANYAVVPANGPQPQSVIAAWQQIWTSDLPRTYSGDFDLYSGEGSDQQVNVYVAIG